MVDMFPSTLKKVDSLNLVANIVAKLTWSLLYFVTLGPKANIPRWWLNQPNLKKCSSNWIISPGRDEKYLSYLTPVSWLNMSPLIQRVNVKEKIAMFATVDSCQFDMDSMSTLTIHTGKSYRGQVFLS